MRFLANENFLGDGVTALRALGHDLAWVLAISPGISDTEVLSRAQAEDRILLTFDKDFGELAFRAGLSASSGIVLFRVSSPSPAQVVRVIVAALQSRTDWAGHFAVVEDIRSVSHFCPACERGGAEAQGSVRAMNTFNILEVSP